MADLVAAVIEKTQAGDPAAEGLHARLCAMELSRRAVHPLGTRALLAKCGLPVAPCDRAHPPLSAEVLHALDCAGLVRQPRQFKFGFLICLF